jgi:ribosomal protein S18 acetylase RimI-like enzyme
LAAQPTPGLVVRRGRPDDDAAELVFDAAPQAYTAAAGSAGRARAILAILWRKPGHSASFEHALVAELDGRLVGVLIAFPARDRYRLHRRLFVLAFRHLDRRRLPLLAGGLLQLILATPRPPRDAYYVGTIAIAPYARRRGVASTLGRHAEAAAAAAGFPTIVAHTGSRHVPARRALERYGLRATKDRRRGYVLYAKRVTDPTRA